MVKKAIILENPDGQMPPQRSEDQSCVSRQFIDLEGESWATTIVVASFLHLEPLVVGGGTGSGMYLVLAPVTVWVISCMLEAAGTDVFENV